MNYGQKDGQHIDGVDTKVKSCWWSLTAYNQDIEFLEGVQTGAIPWPANWTKILGGREACPTTGRLHFQGALNTSSIRFSEIKKVLGQTRIEAAKKVWALQKYAMKEETAVGDKTKAINTTYVSLEKFMDMLGEAFLALYDVSRNNDVFELYPDKDVGYWELTAQMYIDKPYLANLISQPQTVRLWKNLAPTIIYKSYLNQQI